MNRILSLIIISVLLFPRIGHALKTTPLLYEDFVENKTEVCLSQDAPWIRDYPKNTPIVSQSTENEFPRLNAQSVTQSKRALTTNTDTAESIVKEIARADASDFTLLEVAKISHREKMNKAFASAIILTRLEILDTMRKTLSEKLGKNFSEISSKIDREAEKLTQLLNQKWWKTETTKETAILARDRMVQTVMIEHCSYQQYLSYIRANIEANDRAITELENSIRTNPENRYVPQTIAGFRQSVSSRRTAIDQEIVRSENTIKKAIYAFKSMEQSYAAHILLVIIYDDYARLRQNLITYFNANTQYFEKAYNAQNVNQ
jgi:flagellar biosynthesis chaperone FliJ